MLQCHFCGAPVAVHEPVGRDAECEKCGRDLHACRNCRHFDTRYARSCRETMAEPVDDLDRRNFCEYFSFSQAPFAPAGPDEARQREARTRLEALFKKSPSEGA